MASNQDIIDGLRAKLTALEQARSDREARDVADEAATDSQIALQTQKIADLEALIAAGGLTPEQVTALNSISDGMQAVVDSLNAADPTPVVPPAA